jgi:hypothetical protein
MVRWATGALRANEVRRGAADRRSVRARLIFTSVVVGRMIDLRRDRRSLYE